MSTPVTLLPVPPSHWYSSFWHFLRHVGTTVSDTFVKIFGSDAAHTFAVGAESLLRTELGKIAVVAVKEVESMASGTEKMSVALGKVLTQATALGLDIKESMARLLIELAVSRLKGYFGSTP